MTTEPEHDAEEVEEVDTEDPDEIILARRLEAHGTVSTDVGTLIARAPSWTPPQRMRDTGFVEPGDLIPMRRAEAESRVDFEVAGPLEAATPDEEEN